ncbi:MAG: winged helix-turn-helix transcriptional regulator [Fimbriimonadaceae bacterium]|nr:winged helix-turn-helix transcriptional regulator [Fimbriimonadaceae bacterium]
MATNEMFRALSDPTRREILRMLSTGDMTAGDLAAKFQITAPSMSHHFRILKDADLIEGTRKGQQIVYKLNTTVFQDIVRSLLDIFGTEPRKEVQE